MFDRRQNIIAQIRQVVRENPDCTALESEDWHATYGELDQISNHLARAILRQTGNPRDRVAILMDHAPPVIFAIWGVIKAGRVLVVLNPADPTARQKLVLTDSEPSLIITEPAHAAAVTGLGSQIPSFVFSKGMFSGRAPDIPEFDFGPDDIAALVYTSGTTGQPKGVMKTHGQILANISRLSVAMEIKPADRVALLASTSGGHGLAMTFIALLNGAALCPFPVMTRGVTGLAKWMRNRRITIYASSSSLFRALMSTLADDRFEEVRVVRLASDAATREEIRNFQKHFSSECALVHTLSSSETGTLAYWRFDGRDIETDRIPVGRPFPEFTITLVDESGQPVPDGQPGDLVIRSRYQAKGYWRQPELTAARFRQADDESGDCLFFSGDRAKRLSDGTLYLLGRSDGRLKIRGYRIEPEDIERVLSSLFDVAQAVVCDAPGPAGNSLLVAFVVMRDKCGVDTESLRTKLRDSLPDYMVPARVVCVKEVPLTPNGKVDKHQLRALLQLDSRRQTRNAPRTATEQQLAQIWAQAFRLPAVTRDDHFFELGGDSLIAAVISAHIHATWTVEVSMRTFVDRPTLRKLARTIDRARNRSTGSDAREPFEKVVRGQPLSLSVSQEVIWNECQSLEQMRGWTIASRLRIRGLVNVGILRRCMQSLLDRHEILRTTFPVHEGNPRAVIHDPAEADLQVIDLTASDNPTLESLSFCRQQVRDTLFKLDELPLLRFWLIRTEEDEHHLLRINHHIISDNWSWSIYFSELSLLYAAQLAGEATFLPPAPQYVDYAAWNRKTLHPASSQYRQRVEWWQRQLSPPPPRLMLPFERETAVPSAKPSDGVIAWRIPLETSRRLDLIASRNKATYLAVRLAAFLATLAESTGQQDLLISCLSTGRTRIEWQNMFGMFANTVALRTNWNPKKSFVWWLRVVSKALIAVQEHAEIPYHLLCQTLADEGLAIPEINLQFSVTDLNVARSLGDLELSSSQRVIESLPWGFSMKLGQNPESDCYTSFDARLHDPERVRIFLTRYLHLLDTFAQNPKSRMSRSMQSAIADGLPFGDRTGDVKHREAA